MSRSPVFNLAVSCLCLLTFAGVLLAAQSEQVGNVNFPTSCSPQVQGTLDRALALLHSFQYTEAEQVFTGAADQDKGCAMARWGKAMALYHQLWDFPNEKTLAAGRQDVEQAQSIGAKTDREREYIDAAAAFYKDDPQLGHAARTQAYSTALEKLYRDNPKDNEAGEFYALSLVSLAQSGQDDQANRQKAIAILKPIFAEYPNNPGAPHYLIHACDEPEFAAQGLPAARAYAKIAPDSSHALHMPAHIFRQLGLWPEMIDSNLAAIAAAAKATEAGTAEASYQFHAMDFLDYAYLQTGQESKARDLVAAAQRVPGASKGDMVDRQNQIAARNALELHHWKEAASLEVPEERPEWQDTAYWTRAIGAARSGDVAGARADAERLVKALKAREHGERMPGHNMGPEEGVDQLEVEGWVAYAEGNSADALTKLRSAADLEEAKHSEAFSMPAREMLADMLRELKRPSDAFVEYTAALKNYPNRFDALYGAAQSAKAMGDRDKASEYYAKLRAISLPGADRPELQEAQVFVTLSSAGKSAE